MKPKTKDKPAETAKEKVIREAKEKASKANVAKAAKVSRSAVFNCPAKTGEDFPKVPNEKSKRATVIRTLKKGATREELQALFANWQPRHVVECLRILHNDYGYGFETDGKSGKVKILGADKVLTEVPADAK